MDLPDPFGRIERNKEHILLGELGALLHDLGKLSKEFITKCSEDGQPCPFKHHLILRCILEGRRKICGQEELIKEAIDWLKKNQDQDIDDFINQRELSSKQKDLFKQLESEYRIAQDFVPKEFKDLLEQLIISPSPTFQDLGGLSISSSVGDFLEQHHSPSYETAYPIRLLKAEKYGGCDGVDSGVDKGIPGRKQRLNYTFISTAFGYEDREKGWIDLSTLAEIRGELCRDIVKAFQDRPDILKVRSELLSELPSIFGKGLGETRRAANDVTLWDHSYSVASLYKSALAKVLLEAPNWSTGKSVWWRIFRVAFDGLGIIEKGHTIGDMLGYQRWLEEAKDAVKGFVEVDFPIGNEIYRDENGIYFVVPDLPELNEQLEGLLEGNERIDGAISRVQGETRGEVIPLTGLNDKHSRSLVTLGKFIAEAEKEVRTPYPSLQTPPWEELWRDPLRRHRDHFFDESQCEFCERRRECISYGEERPPGIDRCDICGVRPKCERQELCSVCSERRLERAQTWMNRGREATIWIDEVADHNNRAAIIIGRFDLTHWLDGHFEKTYLNSLFSQSFEEWAERATSERVRKAAESASLPRFKKVEEVNYEGMVKYLGYVLREETGEAQEILNSFSSERIDIKEVLERSGEESPPREPEGLAVLLFRKHPSPARLRRIWTTTKEFWDGVLEEMKKHKYTAFLDEEKDADFIAARGRRLIIEGEGPRKPPRLAYEAKIKGIRTSLYWDGKRFITTDNLQHLIQEIREVENVEGLRNWVEEQGMLEIEAPMGEGQERWIFEELSVRVADEEYRPFVKVLTSPKSFLVIVPAADAMEIMERIREKYNEEFSKVKNRLPIHLGVVYFHKRTPLYAAMDAARRMVPIGEREPEMWEVTIVPQVIGEEEERAEERKVKLGFSNGLEWEIDWGTGDPEIPDLYYPYYFVEDGIDVEGRPTYFKVPFPGSDGFKPIVHIKDLEKGDKTWIEPGLFDFEFLDTVGRRFEVAYKGGKRRKREGLFGQRPYYVDQLETFRRIWRLLSGHYSEDGGGLTSTQLSNIEKLIGKKVEDWNEPWEMLEENEIFRTFVRDTLINVGRGEWWGSLEEGNQKLLIEAGSSGLLLDVLELYRTIMKVKPRKGG